MKGANFSMMNNRQTKAPLPLVAFIIFAGSLLSAPPKPTPQRIAPTETTNLLYQPV